MRVSKEQKEEWFIFNYLKNNNPIMSNATLKISVIWWWAGTFNVLYWLKTTKTKQEKELSAIIAMTDSGWTTGEIRDKYWVLPPWDIRRGICALAKDTGMVRELFEYKFKDETGCIWANKIGNTLITALWDIKWSFEAGLDAACEMFQVRGNVIPVTLKDVHLWARYEDGTEIIGEKNIDVSDKNPWEKTHNTNQNITEAFLVGGEWDLNPRARKAILNSDIIVIGPWNLYTSIVANLLSKWMKEALSETEAKIVYVTNIMADKGESTTYTIPDLIDQIEKYAWEVIDYVLVNNWHISDELVEKYKQSEEKKPLKLQKWLDFSDKTYEIVEANFVNESDVVRHDPKKLSKAIMSLAHNQLELI